MTAEGYLLLGYLAGLGLLAGYAILLWIAGRSLERRERRKVHSTTR